MAKFHMGMAKTKVSAHLNSSIKSRVSFQDSTASSGAGFPVNEANFACTLLALNGGSCLLTISMMLTVESGIFRLYSSKNALRTEVEAENLPIGEATIANTFFPSGNDCCGGAKEGGTMFKIAFGLNSKFLAINFASIIAASTFFGPFYGLDVSLTMLVFLSPVLQGILMDQKSSMVGQCGPNTASLDLPLLNSTLERRIHIYLRRGTLQ